MLEVEAKYSLKDPTALLHRLQQWGGMLLAEQRHIDTYLNAPDRNFARTDEALRVRQIGDHNFITYKGPRYDTTTKTRPELEVSCGPGEDCAQQFIRLFQHLGYKTVAQVRKQRRIYELARDSFLVHCCFDDVEGVGRFVELEIVAEEAHYSKARDLLFRLADDLQLGPSETRSYLEMLLGHTVPPGGAH